MPTYECTVEASPSNEMIMEHLNATGKVALDHIVQLGDRFQIVLTTNEIKVLKAAGVNVKRGMKLVPRNKRKDFNDTGGLDLSTGFVGSYLDAVEIDAEITAIAAAHPLWCSVISLPFVTSGYDGLHGPATGSAIVRALRITANPALRSRPGFLLIAGTHAREWMNPVIALEFAQQLLNNIDPTSTETATVEATRIVTEGDVIIVPVLNPDGLNYSIHDDAGWRKNRRPNTSSPSCPGVDNNRNYGVYFGGNGSSANPCVGTYHGPHAFSEPETANVKWLLEEFPNILVAVDSHSYGNAVFRPQPSGGSYISSLPVSMADNIIYSQLEMVFTDAVASVNGTTYSTGTTSNHAGTSDEYMFFGHRVFTFDTECGLSFQPLWGTAQPIIQEVATGFRALANATLNLNTTTSIPLAVVQCIDRTGSMLAFGYDVSVRNNAKRFVDLMSLGDSLGIVTFADPNSNPSVTPMSDRAQVAYPLTLLDDPGDTFSAQSAIDSISFAGWTPIGAGLERSASMLGGIGTSHSILLLSDGFENREPSVASILASWPDNLPVYTIALGSAADTGMLSDIAMQTGGVFQISPTALDLHLIYNQMRVDMSDVDTIMNEIVHVGRGEEKSQRIEVENGVERLELSLSSDIAVPGQVILRSPSGREITSEDFGVTILYRKSYIIFGIERPEPGCWSVHTAGVRASYAIAVFVRSPLRTKIRFDVLREGEVALIVKTTFDSKKLTTPKFHIRSHHIREELQKDKLSVIQNKTLKNLRMMPLKDTKAYKPFSEQQLHWCKHRMRLPKGFSRIHVEIEGTIPDGASFRRVVLRTVST